MISGSAPSSDAISGRYISQQYNRFWCDTISFYLSITSPGACLCVFPYSGETVFGASSSNERLLLCCPVFSLPLSGPESRATRSGNKTNPIAVAVAIPIPILNPNSNSNPNAVQTMQQQSLHIMTYAPREFSAKFSPQQAWKLKNNKTPGTP